MKKVILTILSCICIENTYAQISSVPKEDYILSKSSTLMYLNSSDFANFKSSSIYFNDEKIYLAMNGFKKSPIIFKITTKRLNSDGELVISGKDATNSVNPQAITVTINYKASMNGKNYIDVRSVFYGLQQSLSFGSDSHSRSDLIANIKSKLKQM